MSKPGEMGQSLLIFALLIGVSIWIGTIVANRGEQRLAAACRPIEFTTNVTHEFVTALVGYQPTWTLQAQRYLMGGCYYFFGLVLTPYLQGTSEDATPGGLRGA